jgi:hypothetical protein
VPLQLPAGRIHKHALPAAGGASGVGESVVEYTRLKDPYLLVVGSRGMGAIKRSMMSLIGGLVGRPAIQSAYRSVMLPIGGWVGKPVSRQSVSQSVSHGRRVADRACHAALRCSQVAVAQRGRASWSSFLLMVSPRRPGLRERLRSAPAVGLQRRRRAQ